MTAENPLEFEQRDNVGLIKMDDGAVNALSYKMISSLTELFVQKSAECSAIVIAGNDKVLSAGLDLSEVQQGPEQAQAIITASGSLFRELFISPKPVVIACTGHAMAGGAVFLVVGDEHIGRAGKYKIGFNEVPIGIPMPEQAIYMSQYRMTGADAEAAVRGDIYDPQGALEHGFLDRVVDGDRNAVIEAAVVRATDLGSRPSEAYGTTKRMARAELINRFGS